MTQNKKYIIIIIIFYALIYPQVLNNEQQEKCIEAQVNFDLQMTEQERVWERLFKKHKEFYDKHPKN